MPRKKKDIPQIEYYLRNCHRCLNLIETKILTNGKDYGTVTYVCKINGEYVMPHKIDGCKTFKYGTPTYCKKDKMINKNNENQGDQQNEKTK